MGCRKWRTKPTKCCSVSGLVKQATAIEKTTKNVRKKNLQSENDEPKSALRKRSRCYWKTRSNVKGQHTPMRTDNHRQKYMKTKSSVVANSGFNR